jgi:hypothetical protein
MSYSPFGNTTGGDDADDTAPLPEELVNDTLDGAGKFAEEDFTYGNAAS